MNALRTRIQAFGRGKWLALVGCVYIAAIVAGAVLSHAIMSWIDQHYPNVYFYHMQEDESPGPLGDLTAVWLSVRIGYGLFALMFVPSAIFLQVPLWAVAVLGILQLPVEMVLFVCLIVIAKLLTF